MRSAVEIAASYNRLLLNIQNGDDNEYESLDAYFGSLGIDPAYVQQTETNGRGRVVRRYYSGVKIMIAGGGPTVWLDTDDGMLYASTSGECVGVGLFSEVRDEINELCGIEY